MRVVIKKNYDDVSEWCGKYIVRRINAFKPSETRPFVLGLPTGSTPIGTYRYLIEAVKEGIVSFKFVVTFNMDEYVDLPVDHPQSYHTFMRKYLFDHIDIPAKNIHILNGNASDLKKECLDYENKIKEYGGIELFIGGIGHDGHIAFNEPGSSLQSRTRVKTLAYETIVANSRFYNNNIAEVPKMALTIGVGTFTDAREIMIIVTGLSKALAVHHMIEKGVSNQCTATCVQLHQNAAIIMDEEATYELKVKTVKYYKGIELVSSNTDGMPQSGDEALEKEISDKLKRRKVEEWV